MKSNTARRLFGRRVVGLSPEQIKKNVRYGTAPDRDDRWPLSVAETNPLARAVTDATKGA